MAVHGTANGYKRGCHCEDCCSAYRVWTRDYMSRYRRGQRTRVPAAEVHRHIARLQEAGLTVEGIAKAAGLCPETVHNLVRRRLRTVWPKTADAILGVTLDARPRNSIIPKTAALMLLAELRRAGVSAEAVEHCIGWRDHGRWTRMHETTYRKVAVLYLACARQGFVPADQLDGVTL